MFDELEYLRESSELQRLLAHYAEGGAADRDTWQDRLMELEGVEPCELVRLHGLLIAFGWVEQNTGNTPAGRPGALPFCYRVTGPGVRAVKLARSGVADEEVPAALGGAEAAPGDGSEKPFAKRRERRKAKAATAEVVR